MFQFTTTTVINSAYENGYADEASHLLWSFGKAATDGDGEFSDETLLS